MPKPEKRPAREHALIAAEAALSALTPYGSVLATLMQSYIPSTLQARQTEMLQQLGEDMKRLDKRLNDQRLRSEDFHITMVKIIRDLIVEPRLAKQEAFRAILLNDAMVPTGTPERELFIKITEDLTEDHIRLLKICSNRKIHSHDLLDNVMSDIPSDHWSVLWDGLQRSGLIVGGNVFPMETLSGGFANKTSLLGDRYIQYITLPQ